MADFRRSDGCTVENRASLEIGNGVVIQTKLDPFCETRLARKVVTGTQVEPVFIIDG